MRYRLLPLLFSLLALASVARAQYSKTIHTTFEARGVDRVDIRVVDSLTVEHWAGDMILVQTDVRVYRATEGLFKYLVGEADRYGVTGSRDGATLHLQSAVPDRKIIEASAGTLREETRVKVLLPEEFSGEGAGPYVRQTEDAGR